MNIVNTVSLKVKTKFDDVEICVCFVTFNINFLLKNQVYFSNISRSFLKRKEQKTLPLQLKWSEKRSISEEKNPLITTFAHLRRGTRFVRSCETEVLFVARENISLRDVKNFFLRVTTYLLVFKIQYQSWRWLGDSEIFC